MFLKRLTGLLAGAAAIITSVAGYANPGTCTGACWAHDPAVIQRTSDGVYFRFNTGSLIGIWKSTSLEGPWTYQGAAIPAGSSIDLAGNDDLWVSVQALMRIFVLVCETSHETTKELCLLD